MGRQVRMGAVAALAVVAGCGGGEKDEADTAPAPAPSPRVADRALGYSLTLTRGWTDSEVPVGATRPFSGGGRGCAMGAAGILDDVRGDRLVAFARRTAQRRAAKGALVKARAVRSANVPGGVVALSATSSRRGRRCS